MSHHINLIFNYDDDGNNVDSGGGSGEVVIVYQGGSIWNIYNDFDDFYLMFTTG